MNPAYLNNFSIYYDDFKVDRNGFCEISIYVSLAVAHHLNSMPFRDYDHSVILTNDSRYDIAIASINVLDISYNSFKDDDGRMFKFKLNCCIINMNSSLGYYPVNLESSNSRKERIKKFLKQID